MPDGASLDPDTGVFTWTPTEAQGPGQYTLAVVVTDNGAPALSDAEAITLTVKEDASLDAGPQANDGAPDTFQVARDGANIQLLLNGTVVFTTPFADSPLVTVGGSSDNDTLIVDFSGGNPIPTPGVVYNGGGPGDTDTLVLTGGAPTTVEHTFTSVSDGTVDIDGSLITYTGLEPITDTLVAVNRVFTFGPGADSITLSDNVTPNDNVSRISSVASSETVDFRNPSGSTLTVNAGDGDDSVNVRPLDRGVGNGPPSLAVAIHGEGGNDGVDVSNADSAITIGDFEQAAIGGTWYEDENSNGVQDAGEPGLAGWTIFLDDNANGQFDAGEASTTTDADGHYAFANIGPGTYRVAEVSQLALVQTALAGSTFDVPMTSGLVATGRAIGDVPPSPGGAAGEGGVFTTTPAAGIDGADPLTPLASAAPSSLAPPPAPLTGRRAGTAPVAAGSVPPDRLIDWAGSFEAARPARLPAAAPRTIAAARPWLRPFLLDLAELEGHPNLDISIELPLALPLARV
jgi:hypothetical protein